MSADEERNCEQISVMKQLRPSDGLVSFAIETCILLGHFYRVRLFDGDGFINIPGSHVLNKDMICIVGAYNATGAQFLSLCVQTLEGDFFVATKF
jgi:hypothetical protein